MFERYTENARRVIFFARYEASQFGSPLIEPEHLLLGLLREDKALTSRFLGSFRATEDVRTEIEQHTTVREKVSTSVDLPLSDEGKRVLAYAAEEADQLSHQHIGSEHLLLGLLRQEKCFAAKLLHDRGVHLQRVREQLSQFPHKVPSRASDTHPPIPAQFSGDFIRAVDQIEPLIGRDGELERVMYILCRRTRKNPVLVGRPGVGKKTIITGMARRIADGTVPPVLEGRPLLAIDLSLAAATQGDRASPEKFRRTLTGEGAIFFVEDLHTPFLSEEGSSNIAGILKPLLASGQIQVISTATPAGYADAIEHHRWLEQYFQAVDVAPATEADAVKVLLGIKQEYEKFHGVTYTEDALTSAVNYSSACIRGRELPGKAVDLIDEAGAGMGLRHVKLPEAVAELHKRITFIVRRMEGAIANHEFEKARFYSEEEQKEREHLRLLQEKFRLEEPVPGTVTKEHIENVVARCTGASVATIRQILANSKPPHP